MKLSNRAKLRAWTFAVVALAPALATAQSITLSALDGAAFEGDSGSQSSGVLVQLDQTSASPVTFKASTANGTATAGSDYVALASTTFTIPAGASNVVVPVIVNGDTSIEPYETLFVNISNASGATIADSQAVLTIANNDTSLSITDVSLVEGNSGSKNFVFDVNLAQPSYDPVSFNYSTVDGTATSPDDYAAQINKVGFISGATKKTIWVPVRGETVVEGDETFFVQISNVVGATVVDGQGKGTITNDDSGPATLSISNASVTEGNSGTKLASFTVTLSAAQASAVSFNIGTQNQTATSGSDYVAKSASLSIPAGATSATFDVVVNGDSDYESDETFLVNITNPVGAAIADGQGVGTIANDDLIPIAVIVDDAWFGEGSDGPHNVPVVVKLTRAAQVDVRFDLHTSNGTATAGSDYVALNLTGLVIPAGQTQAVVYVSVTGDQVKEAAEESFFVHVTNVQNAAAPAAPATYTMADDDEGGPTLSIGDVNIAEGNSGTRTATFIVTLPAPQATGVYFDAATANGSATAGTDFVGKSTAGIKIPAGATSQVFRVTINGDTTVEPNETFTVKLSNPVGATIADGQAVGTIVNDDAPPLPTLSIGDVGIAEGNSGTKTATFTVTLSAPQATGVYFDAATASGSATAGTDFVGKSTAAIKMAAGVTSQTFRVTINGDTDVEADETFKVNLSNPVGATIADGQASGTITNDDAAALPTLSLGDISIPEGNSLTKTATFTVTLSAPQAAGVYFDAATASGSATAGSDFVGKSTAAIKMAAGVTSQTFRVTINGDTIVEPNETFTVNLTNPVGATIADGQATGTITNDDVAALTMARIDAKELVDDIDDGNHQPQVAPGEYALLLADTATALCRRAPNASLIAVEGVEHRQVLMDLADAANASCVAKPRYTAVMAEGDSRGFLVELPAKDAVGIRVLGQPEVDATAKTSSLSILGAGHVQPVTVMLAGAPTGTVIERAVQARAFTAQLQARAKRQPGESLVVLGAKAASGLVDVTARELSKVKIGGNAARTLPAERMLVSPSLLEAYTNPVVTLPMLRANEAPAQLLQLQ